MTADNIAVRAESLTKVYQLYDKPIDRLKESLNPFRKKYHHDFHALRDVSFEIRRGDTFGIIGRNGSGKSTLLKIIAGVLTPTRGAVGVSGRVSAILELGVGLNPEMSGVDNIYLNGTITGKSREETARMLPGILSFADIGEFAYQPVRNYSSGMLVRLAFAMAVSVSPDVLIVDEALAVGDVAFQQKCLNELERMIRGGMTLLFVSHDMQMVRNYCQSAIYLRGGEIRYNGSAEMATEAYLKDMWEEQNCGGSQGQAVAWRPVDDNPAAVAYGTQAGRITAVDLSGGEGGLVHQGDRVTLSIRAQVSDEVINPK
ncbi:MAG TPA: polysaccharide ABC transporter ATP-binding protein, partial [Dissulfurispiraceae bacterium]|nr:polysaccharide ABC transporter ATP-binding protein [Dissulfurispiraceae bacterium]